MALNQNPREVLTGWTLHPAAANVLLLLLSVGLGASAWLPRDWLFARALGHIVGGVACGMIVASRGALWQRMATTGEMPVMPKARARVALTGWRCHPHAARVLLALVVVGSCGQAWLPKGWAALHAVALVIGTFAAGMLAARDAAIWERDEPK